MVVHRGHDPAIISSLSPVNVLPLLRALLYCWRCAWLTVWRCGEPAGLVKAIVAEALGLSAAGLGGIQVVLSGTPPRAHASPPTISAGLRQVCVCMQSCSCACQSHAQTCQSQ